MGLLDNSYMDVMSKSMDGLWKRQEVISDNIANYETPNYKRKTVSFENQLKNAIGNGGTGKITSERVNNTKIIVDEDNETVRMDGNSVDLEQESIEMIRTSYQYMYEQRIVSDYFSRLSKAINEGN